MAEEVILPVRPVDLELIPRNGGRSNEGKADTKQPDRPESIRGDSRRTLDPDKIDQVLSGRSQ